MLSYNNQFMIFIIHTGKHTRLRLDLLVGIRKVFMAKRINDEEKADWFGSEHTIGQYCESSMSLNEATNQVNGDRIPSGNKTGVVIDSSLPLPLMELVPE